MIGQGTQTCALAYGSVRTVDHQGGAQALGVGGQGTEHVVGVRGREAERDDAEVDAAFVHRAEQLCEGRRGRQVAPEEIGDAFVPGAPEKRLGRRAARAR